MSARKRWIAGRTKPESQYAITGVFCPSWSGYGDQLAGARMCAGDAVLHILPTQLSNRIQSHAVGALSP
jgi:hypothetical protein